MGPEPARPRAAMTDSGVRNTAGAGARGTQSTRGSNGCSEQKKKKLPLDNVSFSHLRES